MKYTVDAGVLYRFGRLVLNADVELMVYLRAKAFAQNLHHLGKHIAANEVAGIFGSVGSAASRLEPFWLTLHRLLRPGIGTAAPRFAPP